MRNRLAFPLLLGWTFLVWISRIRNILEDDGLDGTGRAWRLGAAALFVVLAAVVLVARMRRSPRATAVLAALVVWTIGWWAIRGIGILVDGNHDAGFKLVHTILMIVSIALAMWAWTRRDG